MNPPVNTLRVLYNGQSRRMSLSQFAALLKSLPKVRRSRRSRT